MQTLITIGVVIYIIFSIRKAMSFGKKPGGKPASGGWQEKLQEMARQIKVEMEKANQQATGVPPVPPPLPGGIRGSEWDSLEETPGAVVVEEARSLEIQVPENVPTEVSVPAYYLANKRPKAPKTKEIRHGIDAPVRGGKPGCAAFRKSDLKRAVVWSEILGKPVSLRD